jgi:rubrerythrin
MTATDRDGGAPSFASLEEFYRHVYALEAEAAERYGELADQMDVHNNREVAALFRRLAAIEARHAEQVRARAGAPIARSPIDAWRWQEEESPEAASFGDAHYLMTPYHALELALRNEIRAEAFFRQVAGHARRDDIRGLAAELAEEEAGHVSLIRQWLAKYPKPAADWADDPDPTIYSE